MLVNSGIASDTLFLGTGSGVLRFVESEIVGVAPPGLRSQIQLRAYPNPLHGETLIVFDLPRTMRVTLRVVDAAGRQVAVPFNGERRRGRNQVEWAHHNLPSGIYQLELRAGSEAVTKSVAILR